VTFGESSGATLTALWPLGTPDVTAVLVQPDGRLVAVASGHRAEALAALRYYPNGGDDETFGDNGTVETPFGPSQPPTATTAFLQPDGKLVVAGWVDTESMTNPAVTISQFLMVRYLGDTPSGTATERFVSQVYLDLLHRAPEPDALASWSGLLDNGQVTPAQVVQMLEGSQEYHQLVVEQLYGQYLHRAADPGGLSGWEGFLAGGGTIDQMRALLLGSPEYFSITPPNTAAGNDSFVADVYRDVLGREVDSVGAQFWGQALSSGADRSAVAASIMRSAEGNADEVQGLYRWLLHRAADPGGLQSFSTDLEQGMPVEQIVAVIAGSPEYAATRT
jgi:hypothetical protein